MDEKVESEEIKVKLKKPGIIYLHYVPRFMTVKKVREYFSDFGEVRRIFLQPEKRKSGKPSKFFTEGWVEFAKKKIAKLVAETLNGQSVGGKRRSPYYESLWSLKYLKNFQWSQLHEKQAYRKAQMGTRMRAEIAQAKREVNFYTKGYEMEKRARKRRANNKNEPRQETQLSVSTNQDANVITEERGLNEKEVSVMESIFL